MRTFINGAGADSTASVKSYLASSRQLLVADLFELKTVVQGAAWSQDLLLTSFDRALTWPGFSPVGGTFVPARIQRSEVASQIGLEAQTLQLDWYLRSADMMGSTSMSILQAFAAGLWDNAMVRLFRLVMPTLGDGSTYGACEMFTGRIADHTFTRTGVQIKVNSLLEVLDQNVPTNMIEPANPQAEYGIGMPPPGASSAPAFAIASGSTQQELLADCTAPTAGQMFTADAFDGGYVVFTSGANQGIFAPVRWSDQYDGHNRFHLYEPLPFAVATGDAFVAYVPYARSAASLVAQNATVANVPGPYTIQVSQYATYVSDAGVNYMGGAALQPGNPAPNGLDSGGGYYAVDIATGTYTFSSQDAGKNIVIWYNSRNAGYMGFPFIPAPEASL